MQRFLLALSLMAGLFLDSLAEAEPGYAGGNGSSFDQAILMTDAKTDLEATHAEYVYLANHFPHYTLIRQSLLQHDNKSFDLLEFEMPDHIKKAVYFDITSTFNKL